MSLDPVQKTIFFARFVWTGGDNIALLNNTIVGSKNSALKRVRGDSAAGVNLFWKNGSDVDDCDLSGEGFLDKNPRLSGDYRLAPDSPCIDAGTAALEYNGQELTLAREMYSGAAPDLGAYESRK